MCQGRQGRKKGKMSKPIKPKRERRSALLGLYNNHFLVCSFCPSSLHTSQTHTERSFSFSPHNTANNNKKYPGRSKRLSLVFSITNQSLEKKCCVGHSANLTSNGQPELKALPAELLHNARKREAKEESTASQPGESSTDV